MWASTLALNSIIGVGVPQDWSSHVIGYELTAIFDLAHAETLAVIFPALLSVRRQEKQAKIVQYAERVLGIQGGDPTERVEKAIQETGAFFSRMGIKTRLRDYGIERSAIDLLIQRLREHGRVALGERGDITPEVARKILEAAY
jgi:NADP-dependent alcohol dehydrogenase